MKKILFSCLLNLCLAFMCMGSARADFSTVGTSTIIMNNENIHIADAQLDVTNIFPFNIPTLNVAYSSSYDMDIARQVLMNENEAANAVCTEISDYMVRGRGTARYAAKEYAVNIDGDMQVSLFGYDGYIGFDRQLSSEHVNAHLTDEGPQEGWGHLDRSGEAKECDLTSTEAKAQADALVVQLGLPFDNEWVYTKAFSPTKTTYLSTGYYEVYYRQLLGDIPVALFNAPTSSLAMGENLVPAHFYGIMIRIFSDGVQNVEVRWLTEMGDAVSSVQVISLEQACQILNDTNSIPELSQNDSLFIDRISLEYAVCSYSEDQLILIPAWTFSVIGDARAFYGIRLNAIDGSLIMYNGWII